MQIVDTYIIVFNFVKKKIPKNDNHIIGPVAQPQYADFKSARWLKSAALARG